MSPQSKAMQLSLCLHVMFALCALAISRQVVQEKTPLIVNFSIIKAEPAIAPGPPAVAATQPETVQAEKKDPLPEKKERVLPKRLAKTVKKSTPPPPEKVMPAEEPPQIAANKHAQAEDPAALAAENGTTDSAAAKVGRAATQPSPPSDGGGLFSSSQLDAPLIVLAQTRPPYPKRARRQNIEGWIKVKFIVDEHGHVDEVTVLDAEPAGIFEQSVLQCVGEWRFKPGTMGGRIVKALVEQTISFKLEG